VVHDFVSGAMENVTATVHYEGLHQTSREMIDENHEDIIAHELSHHWFGDLVTCKSWGQIPLNESFATYAEALWINHKYGSYEADKHSEDDLKDYLNEADVKQMPLIRYRYWDKEDLFDAHSYQKGGYVLRMLHALVGDDAFTKSLSYYLKTNEFKTVEIDQLRIAFETITGKDLHWFFDQWFHRPGHPSLTINQEYNDIEHKLYVSLSQSPSYASVSDNPFYKQPYKLPLDIDIYTTEGKLRQSVVFETSDTTLTFNLNVAPLLVNVDAGKKLLCTKTDNKPLSQFVYQFQNAPLYKDKMEALNEFTFLQYEDTLSARMMQVALRHKYWAIRAEALEFIDINDNNKKTLFPVIKQMALSDSSSQVRSSAVYKLVLFNQEDVTPVLLQALHSDSSYLVIAESLNSLNQIDNNLALQEALKLQNENNPVVNTAVMSIYAASSDTSIVEKLAEKVAAAKGYYKFSALMVYGRYLSLLPSPIRSKWLMPLYSAAEFEKNWMMRYAAISTLYQLRSIWEEMSANLSEEMNKFKKDSNAYKEKQIQLNMIQEQIEQMNKKFMQLQSKEDNDLLKNFYGK
jgi:aminopeptidase N